MATTQTVLLIAIIALVTALTRFLPFMVFRKHTPATIMYLGKVLPYSIMGMLIVYCLRTVSIFDGNRGVPEVIAVASVVILHKLKHNSLISIVGGTVIYMLLVQFVFL